MSILWDAEPYRLRCVSISWNECKLKIKFLTTLFVNFVGDQFEDTFHLSNLIWWHFQSGSKYQKYQISYCLSNLIEKFLCEEFVFKILLKLKWLRIEFHHFTVVFYDLCCSNISKFHQTSERLWFISLQMVVKSWQLLLTLLFYLEMEDKSGQQFEGNWTEKLLNYPVFYSKVSKKFHYYGYWK